MRFYRILFCGLLITILLVSSSLLHIRADALNYQNSSFKSPMDWLWDIEIEVYGQVSEGGLLERLNALEDLLIGRNRGGTLEERLSYLDRLLYINQAYDICLFYKIQALEWVIYKEESYKAIKPRLEKLEMDLFGTVYSGPFAQRVEKLIDQVFAGGAIKGRWVNIPEGLLIKVRILDELDSVKNKSGDHFRLVVADDIFDGNAILFPRGSMGQGVLSEVRHPDNLGRDAQLMVDYVVIRAIDATPVRLFYGPKALKMDRSRQLAVGASAAGMLAFGPGGILLGLVIKGKETTIPAGTEFYLQVAKPVRIYTPVELHLKEY